MIIHPELRIKKAPLYGAWNGYLCIPQDHPAYKDILARDMLNIDEEGYPESTEWAVPYFGEEECTFAEFMQKDKAERFMEMPLNGDWLIIGFDSLHSWDTPETQTKDAVWERLRAWRDAFEEYYKDSFK